MPAIAREACARDADRAPRAAAGAQSARAVGAATILAIV